VEHRCRPLTAVSMGILPRSDWRIDQVTDAE